LASRSLHDTINRYVWQQLASETNERADIERCVTAIQQKLAQAIDQTSYDRQRDKLPEEPTLAHRSTVTPSRSKNSPYSRTAATAPFFKYSARVSVLRKRW
jgi:hypothetical protein